MKLITIKFKILFMVSALSLMMPHYTDASLKSDKQGFSLTGKITTIAVLGAAAVIAKYFGITPASFWNYLTTASRGQLTAPTQRSFEDAAHKILHYDLRIPKLNKTFTQQDFERAVQYIMWKSEPKRALEEAVLLANFLYKTNYTFPEEKLFNLFPQEILEQVPELKQQRMIVQPALTQEDFEKEVRQFMYKFKLNGPEAERAVQEIYLSNRTYPAIHDENIRLLAGTRINRTKKPFPIAKESPEDMPQDVAQLIAKQRALAGDISKKAPPPPPPIATSSKTKAQNP